MKEIWKDVSETKSGKEFAGLYSVSTLGRVKSLKFRMTSRAKGYSFVGGRRKPWKAKVQINKICKFLDFFDTKEEARQAYLKAVNELDTAKILKAGLRSGYPSVVLSNGVKTKQVQVHTLVIEAFVPNPNNLPLPEHKDQNPQNNHVKNLRWATYRQNNLNKAKASGYNGVTSTSKYYGVARTQNPGKPWRARATSAHGENVHIGVFVTEIEAAKARDKYIRDNLPKEDLEFVQWNENIINENN